MTNTVLSLLNRRSRTPKLTTFCASYYCPSYETYQVTAMMPQQAILPGCGITEKTVCMLSSCRLRLEHRRNYHWLRLRSWHHCFFTAAADNKKHGRNKQNFKKVFERFHVTPLFRLVGTAFLTK